MIRRHPHVFAATGDRSPEQVKALWASIKRDEKSEKKAALEETGDADGERAETSPGGLLDDVSLALPGLTRAVKFRRRPPALVSIGTRRAWCSRKFARKPMKSKRRSLPANLPPSRRKLAICFSRSPISPAHVNADPEAAIRRANAKFESRFRFIEQELARQGVAPGAATLGKMDALWNAAKAPGELRARPPNSPF